MTARIMLSAVALGLVAAAPAISSPLADGTSALNRGDYPTAARKLIPLARRGNAEAQAAIGFMYEYGRGVPQDAVVAARWYLGAAEQGHPSAQYQLGLMYDKGFGVPRSSVIAYMWLNLASAGARARERDYYLRVRDAVASKLSPGQLSQAQWLSTRKAGSARPPSP